MRMGVVHAAPQLHRPIAVGERQPLDAQQWRARRHTIQTVKITAKEFIDYCDRTGSPRDIITFKAFLCR